MNCASDGVLRAFVDRELPSSESLELEAHLASCSVCRARIAALSEAARRVSGRLESLAEPPSPFELDPAVALAQFHSRTPSIAIPERRPSLFSRLFAPRWRFAWVTSVAGALLLSSLAFPSARSFAERLLYTLRIEHVQTLALDFSSLDTKNNRFLTEALGKLFSEKTVVTLDEKGSDPGSLEAAAPLAGFPLRQLTARTDVTEVHVDGAHAFQMTLDRERMQEILDQAGHSDLLLPSSIDGATVSVKIPRAVAAIYGNCKNQKDVAPAQPAGTPACVILLQAPTPVVNVPADLDIQRLAETALQLTGMSAVEARKYGQSIDWKTTLVVPIPPSIHSYETVNLNGIQATMLHVSDKPEPGYILYWVEDGIIYGILGPGDGSYAIDLAKSLQ